MIQHLYACYICKKRYNMPKLTKLKYIQDSTDVYLQHAICTRCNKKQNNER